MSQEPHSTVGTTRLATDPTPGGVRTDGTNLASQANTASVLPVRNRVQWGPIFAGLVTALTLFLLLTVLGLALGATVLGPRDEGQEIGLWATIWGIFTTVASFFIGGWVAARSAAVGGTFGGLMNGLLVGAAGLLLVIWLTATGLGNLFGLVSSNVGDILNVAQETAQQQGVSPEEAQQQGEQAADQAQEAVESIDPQAAFEAVRNGALGTFFGMLLLVASSTVGGIMGQNSRFDLWEQQS